jgi:hypothetical protein
VIPARSSCKRFFHYRPSRRAVHTAKELDFDHIYIYVVGLAQTFIRAKPSSVDRLTSNCLLMRVPEVNSSMNTVLAVPQGPET